MSERYELCNPYQPLGPPSQAYRDGWDRIFGKKAVVPHGCVHGNVCDHTPDGGCATCGATPPGPAPLPPGNLEGARGRGHTPPTTPAPDAGLTDGANSPPGCGACRFEGAAHYQVADDFHSGCARAVRDGVVDNNPLLRRLRGRS